MPEYLAPGVYVEETSFRAKSIEGVSTSTAGFVGLTRRGPVADPTAGKPLELITSFGDFERIYGGLEPLVIGGNTVVNHLAHAVRAFFNEGGARLYVSRVYAPAGDASGKLTLNVNSSGDPTPDDNSNNVVLNARFPGQAYAGSITFREVATPANDRVRNRAGIGTFLRKSIFTTDDQGNTTAEHSYHLKTSAGWRDSNNQASTFGQGLQAGQREVTEIVSLNVVAEDGSVNPVSQAYEGLGYDTNHSKYLGAVLSETPNLRSDELQNLFALNIGSSVSAFQLREILLGTPAENKSEREIVLKNNNRATGASDGSEPNSADFEAALQELASVEDISIVAAPGYGALSGSAAIQRSLISHAETRRSYRIAVLETTASLTPSGAREYKSDIDSTYAALYYPWVTVANPLSRPGDVSQPAEISLPPSGFMAGIYARNDVQRGVHKAPANEVVRSALRFERDVNFAEQESLNPFGVNCLRFFPGRGYRVWGARTTSSDPEWKYVNVRRYFNYLEQSIDRGTQWAVFEPNGPQLWTNVRDTISAFLYNEWINGALLGSSPEEAFFVKCDRSTMTQNDLDNGRLICLIGVAVIKPAEFVIFRIGQKTADANG